METFEHSIPAPVLRYIPAALALLLVIYSLYMRRLGRGRQQARPAFNPIVLVLCLILLLIDLTTTFMHRH